MPSKLTRVLHHRVDQTAVDALDALERGLCALTGQPITASPALRVAVSAAAEAVQALQLGKTPEPLTRDSLVALVEDRTKNLTGPVTEVHKR